MVSQDCILFDLDGTLLDTTELIETSFEYTFSVVKGISVPWDQLYQFWGRPLLEQMRLFADDEQQALKMVEVYREHNHAHHDALAKVTPGALATLKALKKAGKSIGVVTSKNTDSAWRGLRLFELDGYVETLVGADQTAAHKPEPEPVFLALERLQYSPERALMIGDSPYDIEAGLRAGTATAGLNWTIFPSESFRGREPHLWLDQLTDLIK